MYRIYWMMNSAWPNLHWQLFDYYLNTAGCFFGVKVGARPEHVSYNYENNTIYLINRLNTLGSVDDGSRSVSVDLIDTAGTSGSPAVEVSGGNIGTSIVR